MGRRIYLAIFKRSLDLLISLLALIFTFPILLAIALMLYVTQGRPIFFVQIRSGENGLPFRLLKFRTMIQSDVGHGNVTPGQTLKESRRAYKTASRGDPRITVVGRILRATHLDELPQLANVILGQMTLVGPRPDVPAQMEDYSAWDWRRRTQMRPGITGLAQVRTDRVNSLRARTALDIYYIRNVGFCFDIWILLRTGFKVFRASSF